MPLPSGTDARRAYEREYVRDRYHAEESFSEKEAARKASWYQRNREKMIAKALERRAAHRQATGNKARIQRTVNEIDAIIKDTVQTPYASVESGVKLAVKLGRLEAARDILKKLLEPEDES